MRKLHEPDSFKLKFMVYDLYHLPRSLKLYDLIDNTDTRYLNQPYAPLINPLEKVLYIELFN